MTAKDFFNDYLNKRFYNLAQETGVELALFYCCAVADVAFDLETYNDGEEWIDYANKQDGKHFADRTIDIGDLLEAAMTDEQRWRAEWGVGSPDKPYSDDDYRYMDELFKTYSARSIAAGNFDAQVEFNLRTVCKQQLLADKSLAKGTKEGVDISTKLTQNILKILESENLRAKDAEAEQGVNIDDIENAIQKKYGIGLEMTREQAMQIFYDWQKEKNYPITVDAVEEIIKIIVNCTRTNNDMLPLEELPPEAKKKLSEIDAGVFDSSPDFAEQEVFDYLNLKHKSDVEDD